MNGNNFIILSVIVLMITTPVDLSSKKNSNGINQINSGDLEAYVSFLASPVMKGRSNGAPELEITVNYLASQARPGT
jgi:hypothetical protein